MAAVHHDRAFSDASFNLKTWLESVLKNYCSQLLVRKTPAPKSSKFSFDCNDELKVKPIDLDLKVNDVTLLALSSPEEEVDQQYSLPKRVRELLRAELKYILAGDGVEHKENFLIEIASVKIEKSMQATLPKLVETEAREIGFYTKTVRKLEDWSFSRGSNIELGVPICFYGQHHCDPMAEASDSDFPQTSKPSLTSEAMSILITNDLENNRYQLKSDKLTIGEVKAVLRELAQIHAVSWAFEADFKTQRTEETLLNLWPFLLQPHEAIGLATKLVESGIEPVLVLLKLKLDAPELDKFEKWLTHTRKRLHSIFEELLTPPHAPLPSSIVHLDLQYQNIAFRPNKKPKPTPKRNSKKDGTKAPAYQPFECRISNWKIASYGSPLHDVAFLFLTSLPPDVREATTPKLLQYYYEIFKETALKYNLQLPFTAEMLETEYKKYFFCAFLFVLGNFEEPGGDEQNSTTVDNAYPYFDNFVYAMQEVIDNGF